jgi:hypothetical protein
MSWTRIPDIGFRGTDFLVRRMISAPDGYLYAVTEGNPAHIYRSLDGLHWQQVATLAPNVRYGRCFAAFDGAIYLGAVCQPNTPALIYRSVDGIHWTVSVPFSNSDLSRVQSLSQMGDDCFAPPTTAVREKTVACSPPPME